MESGLVVCRDGEVVFVPRIPLYKTYTWKDARFMRAATEVKYTGKTSAALQTLIGESPEPLTNYLDVSNKRLRREQAIFAAAAPYPSNYSHLLSQLVSIFSFRENMRIYVLDRRQFGKVMVIEQLLH